MNTLEKNGDNTDSLDGEQDEEIRQVLNSIESFEDVCKTYKSQSAQELRAQNTSEIPKSDQEKVKTGSSENCSTPKPEKVNSEADPDSDYTGFLKQMSVRYSKFRITSGQVIQQKGQTMDYRDYSYNEYPVGFPSCSWQSPDTSGQDLNTRIPCGQGQVESPSSSTQQMSQNSSYYSYGHSLSEVNSGSDETIVNRPSGPTVTTGENSCCSKDSCGCCCRVRDPVQQTGGCHCDQGSPGQGQQLLPVPMGVDPSTGFPIYCCSIPGNYPGHPTYSVPAMPMDQSLRGGGGQHTLSMGSSSRGASSSTAESCLPNGAGASSNHDPSNFEMQDLMRKYQSNVEQFYASAQQGIQQSFANAQTQPYYNSFRQGNQSFYNNPNEGYQQMFGSFNTGNPAGPPYENTQQAFICPLGAQQYYNNPIPGFQQNFPPSMAMLASNFFGNNTGFFTDSLQAQTVYSSDYKPFANDGNHFNHFPNGLDNGVTPESCPICGPAGTAGLAETGTGGQVYAMGGACEMNMNSYPLSQMSYSSPYSYEMPESSTSYVPLTSMAVASPQIQTSQMSGGNPVYPR
ncbi:uncharacterized protein LOC108028094 [Drosophila biarmipes]|uniref:uncharacterized protein LOC108028094 n=1 Tax=Drosophila biarmipes TaxID=125945 RepID=UPI0007E7B485|nr:uncharacterized protein LOC108028094 [Drosophila biarmipes]